jgi:hypothetical protein
VRHAPLAASPVRTPVALAAIDWTAVALRGIDLYQSVALTAVRLASVSAIGGAISVVDNPSSPRWPSMRRS